MTKEGDIVLDPFMGVGSTLLAALLHDRKAIGVDKEEDYVNITKSRIDDLINGTLKKRELGRPVHKPTGKEKVSQLPDEWDKHIQEQLL